MVKKRKYTRFRPKEKTYNYDDYFGAKTNSERNLNLSGSNDRPVNEYIKKIIMINNLKNLVVLNIVMYGVLNVG